MDSSQIQKYKIVTVEDLKDANNNSIPGKYKLTAVATNSSRTVLEAIQTYDTLNKYGAADSRPQVNTEFLGAVVSNKIYILKYVDSVTPMRLENMVQTPQFYNVGATVNEGDYSYRTSPMSFFQLLTNGFIKLQASAGTFLEMIPDHARFSLLKDRFRLFCKNLVVNTFGGFLEWTNFDPTGSGTFFSELLMTIRREDPVKETSLNNNNITIQAGSLTDEADKILKLNITVTDSASQLTTTHLLSIGTQGVHLETHFPNDDLVFTKDINSTSSTETTNISKGSSILTNTLQKDSIESDFTVGSNTLTLKLNGSEFDITTPNDVNLTAKNVKVSASTEVLITGGGTFQVGGTVAPETSGPLNSIMICPFTGAPHAGHISKGT